YTLKAQCRNPGVTAPGRRGPFFPGVVGHGQGYKPGLENRMHLWLLEDKQLAETRGVWAQVENIF
ncbi:hypothetical protein ACQP3F_26405, partial [Escherichia coli]